MARADCDRNLLLGILALQLNFIDRNALVAAFDHWTSAKTRPLAEILVELGKLDTDQRQLLDALVAHHLKLHGGDPEKSLAAVSSLGSVRKELEQLADSDVTATLAHVASEPDNSDPFATVPPSASMSSSPVGRFRILRPHARGGLGEVYVAEDEELHREVALKEIQERHADNSASRSRFVLEAEITGGLEHPCIVPVYGLGQYADGRPFYAMRFIRGDSLQVAIKRFHQKGESKRDPGERSLELRKLLGRFIDVCNAIEYAHSRGVLHRDLKPGNIMLGKYGETLVVDWGLAKLVGRAETQDVGDERTLRPASASGSAPTQIGSAVGTPQYMSPEQAAGRLDELGPTTDVYSLGATLYSLLTGHAAIEDADLGTVLRRVTTGEFPSPRQVSRWVPRALDAICVKAMALKPADRYPSPRILADDVEHWLADEPISACLETAPQRFGRWLRRHRAWAQAAAAALVLVTIVSLVAVGFVNAARQATAMALVAETNAKDDATKAADAERAAKEKAKQAIDRYVEAVQEDELLKDNRSQPLRRKLLADALGYYQDFIRDHAHDAEARLDFAKALVRIGRISRESGSADEARAADAQAVELCQTLAAEKPDDTEIQWTLAVSYGQFAHVQHMMDDHKAAIVTLKQAIAIDEKLTRDHPNVTDYQMELATLQNNLGLFIRATGDRDAALTNLRPALEIRAKLAHENPIVTHLQRDLGESYTNIGLLEYETGQLEAAQASLQHASEIFRKLVGQNPMVSKFQEKLASSYDHLAHLQSATGDHNAALAGRRQALEIHEQLARDQPNITEYQNDLAMCYHNLGCELKETGDHDSALASHQRALGIRNKLVVGNPTVYEYQSKLAHTHELLGILQRDTGDRDTALASQLLALSILGKLVDENPSDAEFQERLASVHTCLGNLERETGDRDAALVSYYNAFHIYEKLANDYVTVVIYWHQTAESCRFLGGLQDEMGNREAALANYRQAIDIFSRLARENTAITQYQSGLATSYSDLAFLQFRSGDFPAALDNDREALRIREKLAADDPTMTEYQSGLADTHQHIGLLLQRAGDFEEALVSIRRALKVRERLTTNEPAVIRYQADIAGSYDVLAIIQGAMGDQDAALASHHRALLIKQKLATENPDVRMYQTNLFIAYFSIGPLQRAAGQFVEAAESFERAMDVMNELRASAKSTNEHVSDRWRSALEQNLAACRSAQQAIDNLDFALAQPAETVPELLQIRGTALLKTGRHAETAVTADKLAEQTFRNSINLYNAGCFYALCVPAVGGGKPLEALTDDEKASQERYAVRAFELFKQAQAAGFFNDAANVEHLGKDSDLDALRERDDFRKFVEELPKPSPKTE